YDHRNVVLLSRAARLPGATLGHHFVRCFRSPGVLRAEKNHFEPRVPEWFAFSIFGFKYAVCVEQKTVAGVNRYVANRIFRCTRYAKYQTIAFDALQSAGA